MVDKPAAKKNETAVVEIGTIATEKMRRARRATRILERPKEQRVSMTPSSYTLGVYLGLGGSDYNLEKITYR